jgi:SAM-dependent methyltransferase
VGAGPGRFALALAPRVAQVVAVDSSPVMVDIVTRRARQLKLTNLHGVVGAWPEVDVAPASVSLCSYVLPLIADAKRFLARLDACTTDRAFVYTNAASLEFLTDPLWRHFHGKPRRLGPTYLDLVAVLAELGIAAEVEVVELATRVRHKDLNAAVKAYRDQLLLADEPAVRRELRSLLSSWLVEDKGGLRPPVRSTPAAIVSWRPVRD